MLKYKFYGISIFPKLINIIFNKIQKHVIKIDMHMAPQSVHFACNDSSTLDIDVVTCLCIHFFR